MKSNKYSLVIIIILLAIFLPLTIYGYIYKQSNKVEENPNHEMYYKGKIWFYNKEDELLGSYECKNEICELAKTIIDDDEYNLDYYKDGKDNQLEVIEDTYALIQDGDYIYLYNVHNSSTIQEYLKAKNYNTKLSNNYYILQGKDNKWGVLYIGINVEMIIPFEYDFIGIKNNLDSDNNLIDNMFIVKQDNDWFLIDDSNKKLTSSYEFPIITYTDKVVVLENNTYMLYDYEGKRLLSDTVINKYLFENKYTGIINNNKLYLYYNLDNDPIKEYEINSDSNIKLEYKDYKVYVYDNDTLLDSFS